MKLIKMGMWLLLILILLTGCSVTKPENQNSNLIKMNDDQLHKENYITLSRIDKAQKLSDGNGVKVAVMDWLFDMSPEAEKMYYKPISFVPNKPYGDPKPWHGSFMVNMIHEIAPDAKIIPIRIVSNPDVKDKIKQKYAVEGIRYAADHGAVAVTNSTGPIFNSPEFLAAIKYAESKGCIFVDVHPEITGWKTDGHSQMAPKSEQSKLVIHSGPINSEKCPIVAGKDMRDLFAYVYDFNQKFEEGYGYSDAPPIIAGVIALMKSANEKLTPEQIRNIIYSTTLNINGFNVISGEAAVKKAIEMKGK